MLFIASLNAAVRPGTVGYLRAGNSLDVLTVQTLLSCSPRMKEESETPAHKAGVSVFTK